MALKLNCLIHGDDRSGIFTVHVPGRWDVGDLKWAIKSQPRFSQLDDVTGDDLDLRHVSGPFLLREVGRKDLNIDDYVKMSADEKLSSIFEDISDDCLQILIGKVSTRDEQDDTDAVTELKEFIRYNTILSTKGPMPSKESGYRAAQSVEATAIYDGRINSGDISTTGPPIAIFHPIFGRFSRIVNDPNVQPSANDIRNAHEFMRILSMIYESEAEFSAEVRKQLSKIIGAHILEMVNPDQTRPDGVITLTIGDARITHLVVGLKREMGGSDPSQQASFSSKRYWIDESSRPIREKCCCPTFLVAASGPWITIMGEVFTDKIIVQRLTDKMWMALSSTVEDPRVYYNARVLIALRDCLAELERYYRGLTYVPRLVPNKPHPRYFPYPVSFLSQDGSDIRFKYLHALEDRSACVTYLAKLVNDSKKVVIKFVGKYGNDVHELLAQHGHAPELLYCGPIPGNHLTGISWNKTAQRAPPGLRLRPDIMHMVVMEYIEPSSKKPKDCRAQVDKILRLLHTNGYAFGDLREQNILYGADGRVKMIDFNWAGCYDMGVRDEYLPPGLQDAIDRRRVTWCAYYPLSMSVVEGMWAPGMEPLAPIRPQHDWKMFDRIFPKVK